MVVLKNRAIAAICKPELAIVTLMGLVIAMLIIPLPPVLIDLMIGCNIVLAMVIFLSALYVNDLLQFSTFPAVLLISTLFRLALSISTSRLILLEGYAGDVVSSFGQFVIGGSLAVGIVIFFIVTIVQFVVITKGSERVAEVCARFSLDAMPGKQMSIDGDLKANMLTAEEARAKRKRLEQENQLFGSMDGAMRFVKGDAIAGLLIILVNFVGGIMIARHSYGMPFSKAIDLYTLLTIGDGLVAQIPALLISIAAGFVVTRVSDDATNLGTSIIVQLLSNNFVLAVAAIMILMVGMLPGFPLIIFAIIAAILVLAIVIKLDGKTKLFLVALLQKSGLLLTELEIKIQQTERDNESKDSETMLPETLPLMLVTAQDTHDWLVERQAIKNLRDSFFYDFGISLPRTELVVKTDVVSGDIFLLVHEIEADKITIKPGYLRLVDNQQSDLLSSLNIQAITTSDVIPKFWCREEFLSDLQSLQIETRDALQDLERGVSRVLSRLVNEYFGIQDTKELLDKIDVKSPELLKEVYRNATVQRISEVFQRLIGEEISLRNSKIILEAIAQYAGKEKDNIALTELIRGKLARYISDKYKSRGKLRCVMLSQHFEDDIRNNIKTISTGSYLHFEPTELEQIFELFSQVISRTSFSQQELVVACSMDVRRFVKKLLENKFPTLDVISWQEIAEQSQLQVLDTI